MIGIICALSIEVEGLTKLLENKKEETYAKMKYVSGTINGKEIVMTECGIGKVNAAMSTQ
ncbi:MAG: 5'-methylthioadenosine/adenosylhomocysteine nucleosidase, partial [Ruminococcus sp.]|nr:5'-methylthioadenosine/adenosylhomocysteine nucleosidase [Ruminococcus sp.]